MKKKLRCPFCGSFPYTEESDAAYGTVYTIRCSNVNCNVRPAIDGINEDELIDTWNTRYTTVQHF